MNIRDLTYIVAVARHGHFGRAAKACNVSQPALSSQIKKVETELGVLIFERDNKSVRLTETGAEIVHLAEQILQITERMRQTASAASDPLSGDLKLGFIPTIAPYLIPHFVRQYRDRLPNLSVSFQEDITERLNRDLQDGNLDCALLATPPEDPRFEAIPLYDEPFWVVYPSGHNLRLLAGIKVGDLPKDELLLLSEGHCFRDQALDICQINGRTDLQTIRATSLETLVNMVVAGFGVTLLPAMATGSSLISEQGLDLEKLNDSMAYRRIYLTYRKTFPRQPLLVKLSQILCENLPETVTPIFQAVTQ